MSVTPHPEDMEGGGGEDTVPSDSPPANKENDIYIHWKDAYWDTITPAPNKTLNLNRSGDVVSANKEQAMDFVAVLAALALLLFLTVLGNALVCLVYRTRFRRNTANLFVVFLAALETVIMVLGVPMEMSVLALPLMFNSQVACKVVRYVETLSVCLLLLTLSAIAVDRYCKLMRPTNYLTLRVAKGLCVGTVLLSLFFALPSFLLFGTRSVPTSYVNVTGTACGVDDSMTESPVRLVYIVFLLLTFVFSMSVITPLYILMFVRICRRKSAARGERVSPARREYPRKRRFVTEDSTSSYCGEEPRKAPTPSSGGPTSGATPGTLRSGRTSPGIDPARVPLKSGVKESARIGQGASAMVDVQSTRMTFIFFIVTLLCVICVLPFLVLRSLQVLSDIADNLQPPALHVIWEVSMRMYLLHPALVPLVYLLCNYNFRREARLLLQKLRLSCKRHPPQSSSQSQSHSHR